MNNIVSYSHFDTLRTIALLKKIILINLTLVPALFASGQPSASEQVVPALDAVSTTRSVKELIMGYIGKRYVPLHALESNKSMRIIMLSNHTISAFRKEWGLDIRTWSLHTGQKLYQAKISDLGEKMSCSPDGKYIIGSVNKSKLKERLIFYDIKTGAIVTTELAKKLNDFAESENIDFSGPIKFSSCGKKIYILVHRPKSSIAEVDILQETCQLMPISDYKRCFCLSPNGKLILVAGEEFVDLIINSEKKDMIQHLTLNQTLPETSHKILKYAYQATFSHDSTLCACAVILGNTQGIVVFYIPHDKITGSRWITKTSSYISTLLFTPDDTHLLYVNSDRAPYDNNEQHNLYRCHTSTGIIDRYPIKSPGISHVGFSPDGNYMAITSVDRTIQVLKATLDIETAL